MTPLYNLQVRLTRLRRVLALLRIGAAACAVLATAGLGLLAVFALDWMFRFAAPERAAVMLLVAGGCTWAYYRFALPRIQRTSSDLETALFVERQHEIDSDLVAALQFANSVPDAPSSPRLAAAVVAYVAEAAPQIEVFQGVKFTPFVQRAMAMLLVVAVFAALAAVLPNHVAAFGRRLLLSSQPYPSRTHVEQLRVGQGVVFDALSGRSDVQVAKAAEGQPLVFKLVCSGVTPSFAAVQLRPAGKWGSGTRVELRSEAVGSGSHSGHVVLTGQLPRFVEPATYSLTAGDAPTLHGEIEIIPLPIVELNLRVEPPAYAAAHRSADEAAQKSAVLEGSTIQFAVKCTNKKQLQSVTLHILDAKGQRIACAPEDESRRHWSSPAGVAELSDLRRELRYEVRVVDDDGLSPSLPLRGVVRVRPDEAPTAALELVHRVILPAARPQLVYRAGDDYGLGGLELVVDIERGAPAQEPSDAEEPVSAVERLDSDGSTQTASVETRRFVLPLPQTPVLSDRLPLTGSYALDLAPLELTPGDRLRLTVEAADYRGTSEAVKSVSEARILEVGDEKAVLAAIREADERSETQLNELIRSELSIGRQP